LIFVRRLVEAGDFPDEVETGGADFVRRDGRIEIVTSSSDSVVSRARTRLADSTLGTPISRLAKLFSNRAAGRAPHLP